MLVALLLLLLLKGHSRYRASANRAWGIPDITSLLGTVIVRLFTAAGKDWFLARLLCLYYYYYSAYAAFLCPDQKGK
jgi:hypothetical protein